MRRPPAERSAVRTSGLAALVLAVGLALSSAAVLALPLAAAADRSHRWHPHVAQAKRFAKKRAGEVSFAVIEKRGRIRGLHRARTAPSASVIKVMLMVSLLRKRHDSGLSELDRSLLAPMIRRSDNYAATVVRDMVGRRRIERLARAARMRDFAYGAIWGQCRISPRDQARFMFRLGSFIPGKYRRYARRLLSHVVPEQRWGVARVAPRGWRLLFKGGWGSGTGLVDHQVALLTRRHRRIAIAVLTEGNPDHAYGKKTLRGVFARLLGGLGRPHASSRSPYEAAERAESMCAVGAGVPSVEFVYRMEAGEERLTPRTKDEAIEIICERLEELGIQGEISLLTEGRLRLLVSGGASARRAVRRIASPGQVYFYDWEPNLIGAERVIGGHPGSEPPAMALRRAKREWRAAGRNLDKQRNLQLLNAGAFPTVYGAVRLASRQESPQHCSVCSASTSRFYLFDRAGPHRLIAGPVASRGDLAELANKRRRPSVVLGVPVGTTIVYERPTGRLGEVLGSAAPGWYALRDRPALTGSDIVEPQQERDEFGQLNVTFGFTPEGRAAFHRVTRMIARRGQARATGPVSSEEAQELSGHFAVIFDGEIKTRPIIDFSQNPDGIDGRTGAQISGGFTSVREARDLATLMRIGGLPINLALIRVDAVDR